MENLTLLDLVFIISLIGQLSIIGILGYRIANWNNEIVTQINLAKVSAQEGDRILDKKLDNLTYELQTIKSVIEHQREQTQTTNNAQIGKLMGEIRLIRQQVNDIMRWIEKQGFKIRTINRETLH